MARHADWCQWLRYGSNNLGVYIFPLRSVHPTWSFHLWPRDMWHIRNYPLDFVSWMNWLDMFILVGGLVNSIFWVVIKLVSRYGLSNGLILILLHDSVVLFSEGRGIYTKTWHSTSSNCIWKKLKRKIYNTLSKLFHRLLPQWIPWNIGVKVQSLCWINIGHAIRSNTSVQNTSESMKEYRHLHHHMIRIHHLKTLISLWPLIMRSMAWSSCPR